MLYTESEADSKAKASCDRDGSREREAPGAFPVRYGEWVAATDLRTARVSTTNSAIRPTWHTVCKK